MADLNVVIDLGKSLVKAIWTANSFPKKKVVFLEPEIVNLTPEDLMEMQPKNTNPENDAWLTFSDGTGQALGFITRNDSYRGRSSVSQQKIKATQGVSRCLAVLGAIAQREGLSSKFSLAFSILLPLSEWSSREKFKQELLEAVSEFCFRGETYHCSAEFSDVKPEGLGLLLHRQIQIPKATFRERGIVCLMMGHFNNSLYFYKNGQKLVDECSAHGFHLLIKDVLDQTALDGSNLASQDISAAIFEGRANLNKIRKLLWNKVGSEEKLEREVLEVGEVIAKVGAEHWKAIGQWINDCLGTYRFDIDELLVSGGASQFFTSEIEVMFSQAEVIWSSDLNQLVSQDLSFSPESTNAHRLADAYSIFGWLSKTASKVKSA